MEIILVVIIIGILYSLSIPSHQKLLEKNKAEKARLNLIAIYNAEKRYKLDDKGNTGLYFSCGPVCSLETINNTTNGLDLMVSDTYFTYGIINDNTTGFVARAVRNSGDLCNGKNLTVTGESSNVTKECSVW